jgi:hypothetical protein
MTNLLAFDTNVAMTRSGAHIEIGKRIMTFLDDLGEDCNVVLEFDDAQGDFEYLFTGTTLSLAFDGDSISVLDFDLESGESMTLAVFNPHEINRATNWLLTQVNHPKSIS